MPLQLKEIKLYSLTSDNHAKWNMDIINDIFYPKDKELILNIPLISDKNEDKWIWAKDVMVFSLLKVVTGI